MAVEGQSERNVLSVLECIRGAELARVLPMLPDRARILELGGGNGFQAQLLTEAGHGVVSIDIADHPNYPHHFYPVETYNGLEIPYPDGSFDVVFSSNVLEHVPRLDALCRGMRRVLAPGGIGVHLMPSPTWRMASLLAHYPGGTPSTLLRPRKTHHADPSMGAPIRASGFTVTHIQPAGLFYTGYCLFNGMSVRWRQQVANAAQRVHHFHRSPAQFALTPATHTGIMRRSIYERPTFKMRTPLTLLPPIPHRVCNSRARSVVPE